MKNKCKHLLLLLTAIVMTMAASISVSAGYVDLKVNTKHTQYDITGDNKRDTIQIVKKTSGSSLSQILIKINGRTYWTESFTGTSKNAYIDPSLIQIGNGKRFLYLAVYGTNCQKLFRYKGGRLVCEINYGRCGGNYVTITPSQINDAVFKIRGNTLIVTHACYSNIGHFELVSDATWSGSKGKMVLNPVMRFSNANPKYDLSDSALFANTTYYMHRGQQGFKTSTSKQKTIFVKKGTKIKLEKYYMSKGLHRYMVKLTNGKKCWLTDF